MDGPLHAVLLHCLLCALNVHLCCWHCNCADLMAGKDSAPDEEDILYLTHVSDRDLRRTIYASPTTTATTAVMLRAKKLL